jgi:hypothetical protein
MTTKTKNINNNKLTIDAPDGWIKLLYDYIEKYDDFIDIDEAIRSIVRSYIVKRLWEKKQILTDYDEGYIQGYADAKELDSKDLVWKGFKTMVQNYQ